MPQNFLRHWHLIASKQTSMAGPASNTFVGLGPFRRSTPLLPAFQRRARRSYESA